MLPRSSSTSPSGTSRASDSLNETASSSLAELAGADEEAAEGLVHEVRAAVDGHAGGEDDALLHRLAAQLEHAGAADAREGEQQRRVGHLGEVALGEQRDLLPLVGGGDGHGGGCPGEAAEDRRPRGCSLAAALTRSG
jgi:hypothetical protein